MTDPEPDLFELARRAQTKVLKRRKSRRTPKPGTHARDPVFSPTQRTGFEAETRAAHFLEDAGLKILAHNLSCRAGEIDLVANDDGILVFIEVKYRRQPDFGGPAASVNRDKQRRLIQSARFFLGSLSRRFYGSETPPCRFDVVTIEAERLVWLKSAFSA